MVPLVLDWANGHCKKSHLALIMERQRQFSAENVSVTVKQASCPVGIMPSSLIHM